jgi:hypothetical protein
MLTAEVIDRLPKDCQEMVIEAILHDDMEVLMAVEESLKENPVTITIMQE